MDMITQASEVRHARHSNHIVFMAKAMPLPPGLQHFLIKVTAGSASIDWAWDITDSS
jgi:hypothetical protein